MSKCGFVSIQFCLWFTAKRVVDKNAVCLQNIHKTMEASYSKSCSRVVIMQGQCESIWRGRMTWSLCCCRCWAWIGRSPSTFQWKPPHEKLRNGGQSPGVLLLRGPRHIVVPFSSRWWTLPRSAVQFTCSSRVQNINVLYEGSSGASYVTDHCGRILPPMKMF